MSKLATWFYNTTLYYKFRYYFIRKKAPLSWIFWGEIMRRKSSWEGVYMTSLATINEPDCAISFNRGEPGENNIEITIYAAKNEVVDMVYIPLSYRNMNRVIDGFNKAARISRKKIRESANHEK